MQEHLNEHWYAVFCKPRQEAVAEENLRRQDYGVYLPRIRLRQRRRGQWAHVVEALFPRYIFVRINPALRSTAPVRSTRGVVGLVRFGGQAVVVPDQMIEALMQRGDAASGLHEHPGEQFCSGDRVQFVEGPLAGMEGVFTQHDGDARVIVLLELLGNANKVRISRDWVTRAA